jgi:hypothetical protein
MTPIFADALGSYLRSLERDYHIAQDFLNTPRQHRRSVFFTRHGRHLLYLLHRLDSRTSMHSCIVMREHPALRLHAGDILHYLGRRTLQQSPVYGNIHAMDSYLPYARWNRLSVSHSETLEAATETW